MSNLEQRVLGRAGARELTVEEMDCVTGGFHTNVCSTALSMTTVTINPDSDGCSDTDVSFA